MARRAGRPLSRASGFEDTIGGSRAANERGARSIAGGISRPMLQRLHETALVLAIAASSAMAQGDPSSTPTAPAQAAPIANTPVDATDAQEAQAIASEFAARFGEPTSTSFNALDAAAKTAAERYFVRGRGAVPRDGMVDWGNSSIPGATQPGHAHYLYGDPVPGFKGLFNIAVGNTGTPYVEVFALQVPDVQPVGPTPMLVAFHKYGVSHADVIFNTNFVQEARTRGWYLLAPIGAIQNNYGCLTSQTNVSAAIAWTRSMVPIDPTRIYGVGFSMGGGACSSFAARHFDPSGPIFAAIIDHTGSVSLWHTYANQGVDIQRQLENLFGGSPASQHFAYQQCSVVDIDPLTNLVGAGTDMARNLAYVETWMADADPNVYLQDETQLFFNDIHPLNPADAMTVVHGNVHSWSTLDDTAACDWLAQHVLEEPLSGTTLADRDGEWRRFTVEQDAAGAFTPFSWLSDPVANRLSLWQTANLHRLSVDPARLGLKYTGSLKLNMSSSDGTGDQVLWLHVHVPPSSVTRNGQPAIATYDPVAQTLLIDEPSSAGAQWVIHF
jgi:hypothetical protein